MTWQEELIYLNAEKEKSETLTTLLREELAMPGNDNEPHLRCTCDECVAAIRAPFVAAYKELVDAALYLPIVEDAMPGGPYVGNVVVERFKRALHNLHVLVST